MNAHEEDFGLRSVAAETRQDGNRPERLSKDGKAGLWRAPRILKPVIKDHNNNDKKQVYRRKGPGTFDFAIKIDDQA